MTDGPRYDRRETSHAFFMNLLARMESFETRLDQTEKALHSIDRGVWCVVKTMRMIGLGFFAAALAILPEYGKSRGWW